MDKAKIDDLKDLIEQGMMQCTMALNDIIMHQAKIKQEMNEIVLNANKNMAAISSALLESYKRLEKLEREEDA